MRETVAIAAVASSALLASLLQTIMTPLVPVLPGVFDASAAAVSWVLTAALLAACATAPMTGRLGDILGKKHVLVGLLAVIAIGSVIGALSTSLGGVITARAFQGVGLGVMALNVGVLRDTVSPQRLTGAIASVSASNGIGGALGLPLSATIGELFDWHGLFWLASILATLCGVAIMVFVRGGNRRTPARFDWAGGVVLAAGLTAVVLAISQWPEWHASVCAPLLGLGLGTLGLWAWLQLRTRDPLIDLRMVFRGPVLMVNLITIMSGFTWFAIPGLVARLLQSQDGSGPGLDLDMITASLVIIPTGLSMLLGAPLARRLIARFGTRTVIRTGSLLTGAAYVVGLIWMDHPWQLSIVAGMVGIGSVMIFTSAALAIVGAVPVHGTGAANAVNSVLRWLGSTIAAAVLGAILAGIATSYDGIPVPTAPAYHLSFILAAAAGLIGWFLGAFLPRHRPLPQRA
ncbi:MFS transporter [Demequina lignilytica]|uniref:MFS transporter n=1 Tax=Demequina lignilytica TaxID=3051663 RepID=A0AB35MJ43_9MICO|nr:MFS transporter [Demequina sp. SYSU T0a273]MDN4483693.1 MFS transporter [Demequina sp. SYSU T0a273]